MAPERCWAWPLPLLCDRLQFPLLVPLRLCHELRRQDFLHLPHGSRVRLRIHSAGVPFPPHDSGAEWARIEHLLPGRPSLSSRSDHRLIGDVVFWICCTGGSVQYEGVSAKRSSSAPPRHTPRFFPDACRGSSTLQTLQPCCSPKAATDESGSVGDSRIGHAIDRD